MPNPIYNSESVPPTYLYIKIHIITGLKYFGKTTRDPEKYYGSGKYWWKHITKHGREFVINELILGPYTNKSELMTLALWMSVELDIVNSGEWANLILENGLDGAISGIPATGNNARGIPRPPAKGKNARGICKGPAKGKNAAGVLKGPAIGKAAKGVPNTGGSAKGVPKTGGGARGVSKGPYTPRAIITCIYCGKSGDISNMKQHHFNNCKLYRNIVFTTSFCH